MRGGDEVSEPLSGYFVMAVRGRGENPFQAEITHPTMLAIQSLCRATCRGETRLEGLASIPSYWEGLT